MKTSDSPEAAVSIILAPSKEGEVILLIKRASHPGDPWSGHLAFPGGKIDAEDDSPLETAIRETREECGLTLKEEDCIGQAPLVEAGHYSGRVIRVQPYTFKLNETPNLIPDPKEVDDAFWLESKKFLDLNEHHSHPFHPVLTEKSFPHLHLPAGRLWGFTYEQLLNFFIRRGDLDEKMLSRLKK